MTNFIQWVLLGLLMALPGAGANAAELADAETEATRRADSAPVIVDGEILFSVRGISALPAEQRAAGIADRIRAAAKDPDLVPEQVQVVEDADRTKIIAGTSILVNIFDTDAAMEDAPRSLITTVYRDRVIKAITAYRAARTLDARIGSVVTLLVTAALFVLTVFVLRRVFRWLDGILDRLYQRHLDKMDAQTRAITQADRGTRFLRNALGGVRNVALVVLALVAVEFALHQFPETRYFAKQVFSLVFDPLRRMGAATIAAIPGLVFIAILFVITRYLLRVMRVMFERIGSGAVTVAGFDPDWAAPTNRIVRLLVVAFAIVVAYPYIPGSDSAAFKGISLFLGVIVSLGSTSVIANIMAGYTMAYRRVFKMGDRVKIEEHIGDVVGMGLFVTHVRTPKNEELVVPNSSIINGIVVNYSRLARERGLILHTTVGIGYETPWRQVEAMLLEAARRTPGLLKEPEPFVLQKGLGDFCVTYEINVYTDNPQAMPRLYTALHENILDVFNEYGVQIMTPAYEGDPEQPKIVPKEQWHLPPARSPG